MSISTEITRINTAVGNAYTAIQTKGGTLPVSQKVAGLADAIATIPNGGVTINPLSVTNNGTYTAPSGTAYSPVTVNVSGGSATTKKLLNFYDYDGTLVASYASNEIQGLSVLPSAPNHSTDWCPLTFQDWNWTLAQIKAYNTSYPDVVINVGATYRPTDNKTHIKFKIGDYDGNGVQFTIDKTGGTVDWGDGNTATISSTTLSHVYSSAGEYDCTLTGIASLGLYSSSVAFQKYYTKVIEIRLGGSITYIGSSAFRSCYSLTSITIPSSVTSTTLNTFNSCYALTSVTIPSTVTSLGNNTFYNCYSLTSVTIPSTVTSLGSSAFYGCYSLTSITIPSSLTSIGSNTFYNCYALTSVTIPSTVTSLGSSAFYNCYFLTSITIPSSVTSIGNSAFYNCYSLYTVIVERTSPPTLSSTNAFSTSYQKRIWVPSSAVSDYKSASNWSSFSSIISANPN